MANAPIPRPAVAGEAPSDSEGASPHGWRRALSRLKAVPFGVVVIALSIVLIVSMTLGVMIGPVEVSAANVWQVIGYHTLGVGSPDNFSVFDDRIVWDLRLPRVILGALVGAGLSLIGAVLQALVRNPLADPFLLGVSSGASVGAVAIIVSGAAVFGAFSVAVGAFIGAMVAFVVVFALAQKGGVISPLRMILAGIAVTYALQSVTQYIVISSEDPTKVNQALFWLFGSLSGTRWAYVGLPTIAILAGFVILLAKARELNALLAGDDTAASLGVNTKRLRAGLLALCAVLTGVLVSLSGAIGFVGLVLPHVVRLMVGSDHRRLLPMSALVGAIFMVWVDVLARMVLQPTEIPIGILTAIIGAPVFLILLRRSRAMQGAG